MTQQKLSPLEQLRTKLCLYCGGETEDEGWKACGYCVDASGSPTGLAVPGLTVVCDNCEGKGVVRYLDKRLPNKEYREQMGKWLRTRDPSILTEFSCPKPELEELRAYCGGSGRVPVPEGMEVGC